MQWLREQPAGTRVAAPERGSLPARRELRKSPCCWTRTAFLFRGVCSPVFVIYIRIKGIILNALAPRPSKADVNVRPQMRLSVCFVLLVSEAASACAVR